MPATIAVSRQGDRCRDGPTPTLGPTQRLMPEVPEPRRSGWLKKDGLKVYLSVELKVSLRIAVYGLGKVLFQLP